MREQLIREVDDPHRGVVRMLPPAALHPVWASRRTRCAQLIDIITRTSPRRPLVAEEHITGFVGGTQGHGDIVA